MHHVHPDFRPVLQGGSISNVHKGVSITSYHEHDLQADETVVILCIPGNHRINPAARRRLADALQTIPSVANMGYPKG